MSFSRRSFLTTGTIATAGLFIGSCGPREKRGKTLDLTQGTDPLPITQASSGDTSILQFCAHPDDDLYFMNPDLVDSIRAGATITSVYLTAGESNGINAAYNQPSRHKVVSDRAAYTKARQNGLRAAYEQMAGKFSETKWDLQLIPTTGGGAVELYTLLPEKRIQLAFMNLLESGDGRPEMRDRNLYSLWTGRTKNVPVIVPSGSNLLPSIAYSREDLLRSLDGLITQCRPTLIRLLDTDPEHAGFTPTIGARYRDHVDHYTSALFVTEALRHHYPASNAPIPIIQNYRTYSNENWPANLGPDAFSTKKSFLVTYSGAGPVSCADPAGCGDHNIGDLKPSMGWIRSTYRRYPTDSTWLHSLPDERLLAVGVLQQQAVTWVQQAPGSDLWSSAKGIGGGKLIPRIHGLRQEDGRLRLFGLQMTSMAPNLATHERSIVTALQDPSGTGFGPWLSLGNPADAGDGMRNREVGVPSAATRGDGRVQVFVRNWGRGVSTRAQLTADTWGPWVAIGGREIQDGLTPLVTRDQRLHLFAASNSKVWWWRTPEPSMAIAPPTELPITTPASQISVVELSSGGLRLFYRQQQTGHIVMHDLVAGESRGPGVVLGGKGGFGPLAVHAHPNDHGHYLVLSSDGSVPAVAFCPIDHTHGSLAWHTGGPMYTGTAAMVDSGSGQTTATVLGTDGYLYTTTLLLESNAAVTPAWARVASRR